MYDNFSRNKLMYNIKVYYNSNICIQAYEKPKRCSKFTLYLFDCDTSGDEDKGMHDDASNLVILTVETIIPITPPEASSNWTGCLK